jgi:sulfatase modifying factor 1
MNASLKLSLVALTLATASSNLVAADPNMTLKAVPGLNLTLTPIPSGTFTMGEGAGDAGPQTQVTISKHFWLGTTEVTVGQWKQFVEATGYLSSAERTGSGIWISTLEAKPDPSYFGSGRIEKRVKVPGTSWRNPGFAQEDSHPVVGISWEDAQQFCTWLTEREGSAGRLPEGYVYRLPTEAQWEYAATAGGKPDPENPDEYSWYRENAGRKTHPVATKKPNAWGLHDVQGNAWEWVHDWYWRYPGGIVTDPSGPTTANSNPQILIKPHRERRGGWANDPAGHGISTRNRWSSWGQDECNWVGFRIALSTIPPAMPPAAAPAPAATKKK